MKKFPIILLLTACASAAVGWTLNHKKYGYREAKFGPFDTAGTVTLANIEDYVKLHETEDSGVGEIQIEGDTRFDFGVMNPDTPGEHEFVFRNVGTGPLKLRLGATTCKCTLGDLEKEVLEPGDESSIKLTWTAKKGLAEFKQSAQLHCDDPKNPVISFEITGKVIRDFLVEPKVWTFGDVATGEGFEVSGQVYNYTSDTIEPGEMKFSSESMTELAEFDVQEMSADELMENQADAKQGFRVTAKVAPGMRQGAVSQNLMFSFKPTEGEGSGENSLASLAGTSDEGDYFVPIPTRGRVVGAMGMIESSKLKGVSSGGYHYSFGKISRGQSTIAKTFVVLKGDERENVTLTVGETFPEDVVRATLGEPKSRGSMVLYPLTIELVRGDKPIEMLGKSKDDFGKIWIETDNPKMSKMGIVLTFAL